MVVCSRTRIQSRIDHRPRAECASLCGTCSNSRRSSSAVFRHSFEAEVGRRSSNSPFVSSSQRSPRRDAAPESLRPIEASGFFYRECGWDGKRSWSSFNPKPWSGGIARDFGSTGDRSRSADLLADDVCSPPIPAEVQALIRRFANENGWRARKVQAELEKLGISVSLTTVSRYLPKRNPDHDQRQRWKTFLRNHSHGIAAMDFIVVPTVRFRLLYAWFVIGHGRREIIHFGVTAHPTSPWVVQQLREAFPDNTSPRFLIYDNDSIFSERVTESIENIGIEPRRTAFYS